jgi:ribonuclease-3
VTVPGLTDLEARIGHRFADRGLLVRALTHSSFANEASGAEGAVAHNERLEFLGDAVLDLAVTQLLLERLPGAPEGVLSQARAAVVSERSLAAGARGLGLGSYLRLGRGEERTGGREKPSILADAYEALLGAVYLDAGWPAALALVRAHLGGSIELAVGGQAEPDYKTRLQERVQQRFRTPPRYVLSAAEGPDHARTFEVEVTLGGAVIGRGRGASKKEAEQRAAAEALAALARQETEG